jgi:phage terminase large subunit-like protein
MRCGSRSASLSIPGPISLRELGQPNERFRPSVVLIEDKASGTQLIQELIAEGLHAVTRTGRKRTRSRHARAVSGIDPGIENGFVRVPHATPWLAQ